MEVQTRTGDRGMKSYYLLTLTHPKPIGNIAKELAKELTCECFLGKEISLIEVQQHEILSPLTKNPNLKGKKAPISITESNRREDKIKDGTITR